MSKPKTHTGTVITKDGEKAVQISGKTHCIESVPLYTTPTVSYQRAGCDYSRRTLGWIR